MVGSHSKKEVLPMFDKLFKYAGVLARHRDDPLSDARESYLSHRADEGTAPNTLLCAARKVLVIALTRPRAPNLTFRNCFVISESVFSLRFPLACQTPQLR
jgi:hypothetical protein